MIFKPLSNHIMNIISHETEYLIDLLNEGYNIALVSDAGLPLISDPGYELVVAHSYDIHVETVPGPNAGLTALMASGLPSYTYTF